MCNTPRHSRGALYPPLCRVRESQFIYAQLPCTVPRVNNEATGCRRPHRREPSMTDRATLMARITRPVSPSHPPAILWQPTRPTPPNLFYDSLFKNKQRILSPRPYIRPAIRYVDLDAPSFFCRYPLFFFFFFFRIYQLLSAIPYFGRVGGSVYITKEIGWGRKWLFNKKAG